MADTPTPSKASFFQTLPGLLTALATLVSALVAGYLALKPKTEPAPQPRVVVNESQPNRTPPADAQRLVQQQPQSVYEATSNAAEEVDLSGKWTNESGYLVINQEGGAFTFNDFNTFGANVGNGTGTILNNRITMRGVSDQQGLVIEYYAEMKLVNQNNKMVGTIYVAAAGKQSNIYFNRE